MNSQAEKAFMLHRWITGAFSNQGELIRDLRACQIPCEGADRYRGLVIRIDSYRRQRQRLGMETLYQARLKLLESCRSCLGEHALCSLETDTYVVAILVKRGNIRQGDLNDPIAEIQQIMKKAYGISLSVGIGTHATNPAAVPESVRNAHIAVQYRMVYGMGQIIPYENIAMRVGLSPKYPDEAYRAVIGAFERGDSAEFERNLELFFSACYTQSVKFGLTAVNHLLMELYRCMPESIQAECDLIGYATQLSECDHISQQIRMIRSFGLNAIEGRNESATQNRYRDQFDRILEYVSQNYTNPDISITAIAEHAGLSSNTIRMLFREHGLSSPKDYIHSLRMEKACQLLVQTTLPASEIGERVGFLESRYFYTVFKKYTGLTAYEYRAQMTAREEA